MRAALVCVARSRTTYVSLKGVVAEGLFSWAERLRILLAMTQWLSLLLFVGLLGLGLL